MRTRVLVRAVVGALVLPLIGAAAGWLPAAPALAIAAIVALVLAGEAFLAFRHRDLPRGAEAPPRAREALVDTSALIDGRLPDVVRTGFLDWDLVVPGFVLRELQHVADAADAMRRSRGRRGLDALQALREGPRPRLTIVDEAVEEAQGVDAKLVALARHRGAALITTDFSLNRVATALGVLVLNVNDLAHALRPVVLPGEILRVTIVKDGKEPGQGVGYLQDGTMVVVEKASGLIGRTIDVVIASAIQTAAGKMFFARLPESGTLP